MSWFAFDIDAYDADTMHLSVAEDGAYMRLIRHYYKTRLPLPDDDRALAAIARVSAAEWGAIKETVRAFFKVRRGCLIHRRINNDLEYQDKKSKQRSEHAKNAAQKRHALSKGRLPRANTEQTTSMPDVCQTMLPDKTRPDKKDSEAKASAADAAREPPIPLDTKAAIFGEQLSWLRENTDRKSVV